MTTVFAQSLQFSTILDNLFDKMLADTIKGKISPESLLMVGAFFGLFVLMILLSMFLTRKPAKRLLDTPINWITEHKRISEMLDAAVVQRCKVRVSFHRSMGVGRSTDGTLLDSGKNGLTLEIPSLKVINQKWIGRTLDLSMRMKLPDQPQLQSNVGFVSDITGFEQPGDDITVLKLSLPIRLELDQNRQHLRVEPPEKYVRSFMIWTEEAVRKRAGKLQDPESWGPPIFLSVAAGQQELELENLSGGGLRVRIEPQALRQKNVKLGLHANLICALTLTDIGATTMTTYYLMCQVVKCFDDCESQTELSLGLLFTAAGQTQQPPLTGLRWRTVVRDYGLFELDNWAYELHLELYRSHGVA